MFAVIICFIYCVLGLGFIPWVYHKKSATPCLIYCKNVFKLRGAKHLYLHCKISLRLSKVKYYSIIICSIQYYTKYVYSQIEIRIFCSRINCQL